MKDAGDLGRSLFFHFPDFFENSREARHLPGQTSVWIEELPIFSHLCSFAFCDIWAGCTQLEVVCEAGGGVCRQVKHLPQQGHLLEQLQSAETSCDLLLRTCSRCTTVGGCVHLFARCSLVYRPQLHLYSSLPLETTAFPFLPFFGLFSPFVRAAGTYCMVLFPVLVLAQLAAIPRQAAPRARFRGRPPTMPTSLFSGLSRGSDLFNRCLLHLKDGEVGPCLQVGDNLLGCSVARQVARRRVLPLLQDADCALGLLHHSQDAVEHLVEAKMIIIENDFNTSKEYIFILAYFQASAGNSAQKVGSRFLFQNLRQV